MKLIIQIPCYNEEKTLPLVLNDLPKEIDWINIIETMIIDDGSSDKTVEVAKKMWVNHIFCHIWNKWLWNAFKTWSEKALKLWADILVNTDWDAQYPWKYIIDLVAPILQKEADIVIWNRQTSKVSHFSPLKKFLQFLGSFVVRKFSWLEIEDSVSWFRAYSRESLMKINITTKFSYVIDTIMQASDKNIKVKTVKITINPVTRPSRLFKNIGQHIYKTTIDLFRIYLMNNPFKAFLLIGMPFFILWNIWVIRFLYYFYITPVWTWKIQSLVISWVLLTIAVQLFAMWIIGDLIGKNRKLIEDNLYFSKKNMYKK